MSKDVRARLLNGYDRSDAIAFLRRSVDENLVLIDFVDKLGRTLEPGELRPEICGAFSGDRIVGIAVMRPCIAISAGMSGEVLDILLPYLRRVPSGLMKSERRLVEPVWKSLEANGRRATIDRVEIAYRLHPKDIVPARPVQPGVARPARREDLDELDVGRMERPDRPAAQPDDANGTPIFQ